MMESWRLNILLSRTRAWPCTDLRSSIKSSGVTPYWSLEQWEGRLSPTRCVREVRRAPLTVRAPWSLPIQAVTRFARALDDFSHFWKRRCSRRGATGRPRSTDAAHRRSE